MIEGNIAKLCVYKYGHRLANIQKKSIRDSSTKGKCQKNQENKSFTRKNKTKHNEMCDILNYKCIYVNSKAVS